MPSVASADDAERRIGDAAMAYAAFFASNFIVGAALAARTGIFGAVAGRKAWAEAARRRKAKAVFIVLKRWICSRETSSGDRLVF